MEMLRVRNGKVRDPSGREVRLKGTCIGGWMNMENFLNGYPGSEHGLRSVFSDALGPEKTKFFFDRWLDHFFNEEDVKFIAATGSTAVRIPLNYRHFERDDDPFRYSEDGFRRLDRALSWCERHGLHVILDLHAVQGWQNPDWHCDNQNRVSLFWTHRHFQDRFIALWEEFARRYKGKSVVAGYNLMNEPVTNAPRGRFPVGDYRPRWDLLNAVYRRAVAAIRAIDPDHIIYLEGDLFSSLFDGMDPPFAENLVYSSHNYLPLAFREVLYPGKVGQERWDLARVRKALDVYEGTVYTRKHDVPLWVGEFGYRTVGRKSLVDGRRQFIDDQIGTFEEAGAHWTTWNYKDVGSMSWMMTDPDSDFNRMTKNVVQPGGSSTKVKTAYESLKKGLAKAVPLVRVDGPGQDHFFHEAVYACYAAGLMQFAYAEKFRKMTEKRIDKILSSFALKNCVLNEGYLGVIRKYCGR